jgi:ligand-binding sensor domain-containing protein
MDPPYRTTIWTLMRSSGSDTLFLAAQRGLVGAIPPDGRVSFFKPETKHLMTLPGLPDSDSLIWMRFKNSLARFNCREGRFDLYAQPPGEVNPIMDISHWDDTTLLVCGSSLFLFDKNRQSFKRLSLPVRNATRAIRDAAGVVWLCSRQGFARWNPANNQIVWYNPNDGLPETDFGMQHPRLHRRIRVFLVSSGFDCGFAAAAGRRHPGRPRTQAYHTRARPARTNGVRA